MLLTLFGHMATLWHCIFEVIGICSQFAAVKALLAAIADFTLNMQYQKFRYTAITLALTKPESQSVFFGIHCHGVVFSRP